MEHSFNPYPVVGAVKTFLMCAVLALLAFYIRPGISGIFDTLIAAIALVGLTFILLAFLVAKFHTITLSEQTITYRSGIIVLRKIMLPYSKITEASYTQGLIQRIFGVGTLRVDTAGGSMVAIYLADVRYGDLKKILAEINAKTGKDAGI